MSSHSPHRYPISSFCAIALILVWSNGFSQTTIADKVQDLLVKDGITVSAALNQCNDQKNGISNEYVFLSLYNENVYPVRVSFKKNLWFDGKCASCDSSSDEHIVSTTIAPQGHLEANCYDHKELLIFSRMLNGEKARKLTNYELADMTVDEIK